VRPAGSTGEGLPARRRRFPALNVALFAATIATTIVAGAGQAPLPQGDPTVRGVIEAGLPFSAALLGVLLCHEMGHYLLARAYRVDTTLPFFIPGPPPAGTFGAVIRIRSPMPTRRAVLDIGAAGPIAGFAVAVPLYLWGLAHSEVKSIGEAALGLSSEGSPFAMLRAWLRGEALSAGHGNLQLMGDSLATWAMQRWIVGPVPPGSDVFVHPVAFAAWLGLLVTTLNLLPIGQLDGGHVVYALLGRERAHAVTRAVSLGLLVCGFFLSWTWLFWWVVTRVLGRLGGLRHPPALVEEPLTPGRRAVAILCLFMFAATFIPVPISV
jgi:membrane-associated protease RseP (regulator of RpoE activity)